METRQQINNNSLSQIIAEKITEQIITGGLQPGEKIVETVYADEYGTSRAPVREALYLLTIEGLVERIPRKGAIVKEYPESEIHNLLEIRLLLETLAMKKVATLGVDNILIEQMESLIPLMQKSNQSFVEYAQLNQQYHNCIIEMSKSEIIYNMYSRLGFPLLYLQRMSFLEEKNIEKSIQEHLLIISMLKENKISNANEVLKNHNEESMKRIEDHLGKRKKNNDID